ncbi:MAG TPA: 50S ribosomal protein L11 methyltransferase [Trebonia sp.]|nr:50S ribosomal protein L11 methyltransferase [Trebonia sp.]
MRPRALDSVAVTCQPVPFVPELVLLTADQPWDLWNATGRDAPPFWAFPWAGGQALARYVLDNPAIVRDRSVLDVASGSGLVAIAAAKAGAVAVTAADVDPDALAIVGENALANEVAVTALDLDLASASVPRADVVLAADVFYQRELAATALAFLRAAARAGADVLCADPGRAFVPRDCLAPALSYEVPVLAAIEDSPVKTVTVYRLA